MAFETLTKTLTEAGLAPEVVTQLVSNEKAAKQIQDWHESGLRQSDYDRKMNSGKAELDATRRSLQEEKTAFEEAKKSINDQYMSALTTREQAEAQLATLRAKVKTAQDVYGVPLEKELFGDTTQQQTQQTQQPNINTSKLEERVGLVEGLFRDNVKLQTELMNIERQHRELFPDKAIDYDELLADAVKQRRGLTQVWDDKFGASAKRTEIMADKYRAEGAAKAKEELEKKYSGQQVNGIRTDIPMSPVFQLANQQNKGLSAPKDRDANGRDAVARAVEAFSSGKYRQGGSRENSH